MASSTPDVPSEPDKSSDTSAKQSAIDSPPPSPADSGMSSPTAMKHPPFRFFVPTTNLADALEIPVDSKKTEFTILSYSTSTSEAGGLAVLKSCVTAFPKESVRNLVCLQPERIIHNEILAQLQAGIKLDTCVDDEFISFGQAFNLVKESLTTSGEFEELHKKASEIYQELQTDLVIFYDSLIRGAQVDVSLISRIEQDKFRDQYNCICSNPPWDTDPPLLKATCLQRWLSLIYSRRVQDLIFDPIAKEIDMLCNAKQLSKLEYVKKQEGIAIFTTGGVASGKGTCLRNIEATLKLKQPKGIAWNELVHHNADRIKPFLLDPEKDSMLFSQYTYEEALSIKERVMSIISRKGRTTQSFPHFLHDQTKLKADEIAEASARYGEVIIAAVSTDVATAMTRAHRRGEMTKRFEHTAGLLGSHQAVPGEFIKAISQRQLIGCKVSVAMYDNNSPNLRMFAAINMETQTITIHDDNKMHNWIKKETINPRAHAEEQLYTGAVVRSSEEYFAPLCALGFTLSYANSPKPDEPSTTEQLPNPSRR